MMEILLQEPGMEAALAEIGPARVLKSALTSRKTGPPRLPEGQQAFAGTPDVLPSWLSEEEVNYYVSKYERTGFTGGLNYYRNMDLYVTFILNFTRHHVYSLCPYIICSLLPSPLISLVKLYFSRWSLHTRKKFDFIQPLS